MDCAGLQEAFKGSSPLQLMQVGEVEGWWRGRGRQGSGRGCRQGEGRGSGGGGSATVGEAMGVWDWRGSHELNLSKEAASAGQSRYELHDLLRLYVAEVADDLGFSASQLMRQVGERMPGAGGGGSRGGVGVGEGRRL